MTTYIKKIITYLILITIVIGAGTYYMYITDPYRLIIPQDTTTWDKEVLPKISSLNSNESQILIDFLDRYNPAISTEEVVPKIPYNLSVKEAIAIQKKYILDPNVILLKNSKKNEEEKQNKITTLNNSVFVTIATKTYDTANNKIIISYGIKNKSKKEITLIKGSGKIKDKEGVLISTINEELKINIKPGEITYLNNEYTDKNIENFNILANTKDNEIYLDYNISEIIFIDNTSISQK